MIQHFFNRSSELVKTPIKDVTGQSDYIDDHLGKRNSAERESIGRALQNVAQSMKDADASHSVNNWLSSIEAE